MSISSGSRERVPFITLVELNEGESEGVGRPKSEKSVPRICLTSDDRRSLLRFVDSFDWRFLPSRALVRELGSDAVLELFLDSSVPRSEDWSDFPRLSKERGDVAVLFPVLEETGEEPFCFRLPADRRPSLPVFSRFPLGVLVLGVEPE
ncbi:hypothetical protein MTO96_022529 [Rhipicephalus appendiculatus]